MGSFYGAEGRAINTLNALD